MKKVFVSKRDYSKPKSELTEDGFAFEKEQISNFSKTMTKENASTLLLTLTNSSKIMGRSVMLAMYDPKMMSYRQKAILWLFKKLF